MGHHQAPGAGEVDVLLPVPAPPHLHPTRGGVDGGALLQNLDDVILVGIDAQIARNGERILDDF